MGGRARRARAAPRGLVGRVHVELAEELAGRVRAGRGREGRRRAAEDVHLLADEGSRVVHARGGDRARRLGRVPAAQALQAQHAQRARRRARLVRAAKHHDLLRHRHCRVEGPRQTP